MAKMRKAAVAIAVSDAPPCTYLGEGVLRAAEGFRDWARAMQYDTRLITDRPDDEGNTPPVTIQLIRETLEDVLKKDADGDPVYRLLIFFAGHGYIKGLNQGLWLPSDWSQTKDAIYVESLQRRLGEYGVTQVGIFSDACRSFPNDAIVADLNENGVLHKGWKKPATEPDLDKFTAAQDGKTAFVVPGANPSDDRCLFTGVLLEGLWAKDARALSKIVHGKVTSRSLKTFLKSEAPLVAKRYKRELDPSVSATFGEEVDIYFSDIEPPPEPPAFPPWPAPPSPPPPPRDWPQAPITTQGYETGSFGGGTIPAQPGGGGAGGRGFSWPLQTARARRMSRAHSDAERLSEQLRSLPRPATDSFAIIGSSVLSVRAPAHVVLDPVDRNVWRFAARAPEQVLIELETGLFASAVAIPGQSWTAVCDDSGVTALVYAASDDIDGADLTVAQIAKMDIDAVRSDKAPELARSIRDAEVADPMLATICAYLYDADGDRQSILRIAHHFVSLGQAVPFDVAALAKVTPIGASNKATFPAAPSRDPLDRDGDQHVWHGPAAPEASGVIAGRWPWLRQGWTLGDRDGQLTSVKLTNRQFGLARRPFTTFDAQTGKALTSALHLASITVAST